jgi:hypothetical protein
MSPDLPLMLTYGEQPDRRGESGPAALVTLTVRPIGVGAQGVPIGVGAKGARSARRIRAGSSRDPDG